MNSVSPNLVSPEADLETRIQVQVVYLGSDPQDTCRERSEMGKGGRAEDKGCATE
jgi:hypothetical protein